jgi:hypothetical protein
MKTLATALLLLALVATPALAERHYYYAGGYAGDGYRYSDNGFDRYDVNGNLYCYDRDSNRYIAKVRSHKRRRNVLLGVGAVGLLTGSGALTGIGLGGAAVNEVVDHRHRDY